jgi:hypothetical protein
MSLYHHDDITGAIVVDGVRLSQDAAVALLIKQERELAQERAIALGLSEQVQEMQHALEERGGWV